MKRREMREHIFKLLFMGEFNTVEEMPEQSSLYFETLEELSPQEEEYMRGKYEKVLDDVVSKMKDITATKTSGVIRIQCQAIFEVFNDLCGEGTDKKIFGDKVNLVTCMKAFAELVEYASEQKGEVEKLISKYTPNRLQRRNKK